MKTNLLHLSLLLLAFSFSNHAQEHSMDYGEINQVLDIAHNQVSSEYFVCVFKVKINNSSVKFSDVSIWLTWVNMG